MDHLAPLPQNVVASPSALPGIVEGLAGGLRRVHPRLAASLEDDIDLARRTPIPPLTALAAVAVADTSQYAYSGVRRVGD